MIRVGLVDPKTGSSAQISNLGQVTVGDSSFSEFHTNSTASNNVAVNVVLPRTGHVFIITAIVLSADRSVGANGAVTDVFENNVGPTDGTITKQILQEEIAKQTRSALTGLNIRVTAARWVNIKSDDVIVRANIAGYYLPV